ncbi:MAG: hypothetical protein EOO90_17750 [Pedobacter sp.]|nr:MAG: hypothetical protein EOO90_17750 [Pedobacter sp.]
MNCFPFYHLRLGLVFFLLVVGVLVATAQTNSLPKFTFSLSSGATKVFNSRNAPLFATAENGFFVDLSAARSLGKNWGALLSLEHNVSALNTDKAIAVHLFNDAQATSIHIDAGPIQLSNLSAGVYYKWPINQVFALQVSPRIGYSHLQTPNTLVEVATVPHTSHNYARGNTAGIYYAIHTQVILKISNRIDVDLNLGYGNSRHQVRTIDGQERIKYPINISKLNLGAGVSFTIW